MTDLRKGLTVIGAVVAACLLMAGSLYGVWVVTDEGKDFVSMRLITVGMLIFNQLLIMTMVSGVILLVIRLQKAVEAK